MNSVIGLDIGSHTIKLIELGFEGDQPGLLAAGSMPTPPKAMSSALQADLEAVAVALK